MKLSMVATLYKSRDYIDEFVSRASIAAAKIAGEDYEIILVNDGSPDCSLDTALKVAETNPHLVIIDLSKNFGHHKAMIAGLTHALGDSIFLIDSDLEEKPEWLIEFYSIKTDESVDVVYGIQECRKGGFFERWSGEIYYGLINAFFGLDHPRNITTARLMTKQYVSAFLAHREREIVISALWMLTGFKQIGTTVSKSSRDGKTTYSLAKKFAHLLNVVTSFSARPLIWIFLFGLVTAGVAFLYGFYLIVLRLFFLISVDGFTSIMVSIWFLGGLNIFFIGVIGLYLSKIFIEAKQRPTFIVRDVYGRP